MEDLTLISCSYNTPDVTLTMLKSWMHVHGITQKVLISENSTDLDTRILLDKNNVPYISNSGMSHGDGVNKLIDLCTTRYALLVDTDVIFLLNHETIFNQFKEMGLAVMGKVEGDRGGKSIHNRVNPWHCFIDVDQIKANEIIFFDEQRMRDSFKADKLYDIGSTFFEDIRKKGLKVGNIDLADKYYIHMEGMSWYKNKYDGSKGDTGIDFGGTHNNHALVDLFERKYKTFNEIKQRYNDVNIEDKYIARSPKLLIKFPTRGRSEKFFQTLDAYYDLLSNEQDVSFFVTCDEDDLVMNNTAVRDKLKSYKNLEVEFGNSRNKIEAINSGVSNKDFDIVLLASDDMIPVIKGYDSVIVNSMCRSFPDFDGIVWFNDGVQGDRLNTLCILGKKYYNRFGYIYYPEYKSLWCDMEFTVVGNLLNKQKYFNQVIIRHDHHSVINSDMDETYINNEVYENEDKNTFLKRQTAKFNL